jgi:hypothetical protein
MVGWIPYSTIALIQIFANSQLLAYLLSTYFTFIPYFFMPNIKNKVYDAIFSLCWGKIIGRKNKVHIRANEHGTAIAGPPLVN